MPKTSYHCSTNAIRSENIIGCNIPIINIHTYVIVMGYVVLEKVLKGYTGTKNVANHWIFDPTVFSDFISAVWLFITCRGSLGTFEMYQIVPRMFHLARENLCHRSGRFWHAHTKGFPTPGLYILYSLYIYIYVCMYICMYACMCLCINSNI